jgi:dihydrofolate synthase/folylpolyglutamate synthase
LFGEHQKVNAALALATVEVLQKQIPVAEEKLRAGLANVNWPGRLQLIEKSNGQKILLDGAHNVAGAKVLHEALEKNFPAGKRTFVLGVLQDKDWRRICETLAPLAVRIFVVPVSSERTASPNELAPACLASNPSAEVAVCDSLDDALKKCSNDEFIVVTGSLYLVGEALMLLGFSPENSDERGLNEWVVASKPAPVSL